MHANIALIFCFCFRRYPSIELVAVSKTSGADQSTTSYWNLKVASRTPRCDGDNTTVLVVDVPLRESLIGCEMSYYVAECH